MEDRVPIVYNEVEMDLSEATYVVFDVETTVDFALSNDLIQVAAPQMYKGGMILLNLMNLSILGIPCQLLLQS